MEYNISHDEMQAFLDDLVAVSIKHGIRLKDHVTGVCVVKIDDDFEGYSVDTDESEFYCDTLTGGPKQRLGENKSKFYRVNAFRR